MDISKYIKVFFFAFFLARVKCMHRFPKINLKSAPKIPFVCTDNMRIVGLPTKILTEFILSKGSTAVTEAPYLSWG
jgi:hypothetical protein